MCDACAKLLFFLVNLLFLFCVSVVVAPSDLKAPIIVIQLTLTLEMTTAQVVETSVTVNNNSPIQDYVHQDDQTQPTFVVIVMLFLRNENKLQNGREHRPPTLHLELRTNVYPCF